VEKRSLVALYDFFEIRKFFPDTESREGFCILSLVGSGMREKFSRLAFGLREVEQIDEPGRVFSLTPDEILLLSPNTGTCPIFVSRRDAEITLGIYRRVPILIREHDPEGNPWGIEFRQGLFNMTSVIFSILVNS
jgi:hypothetical protein